MKRYDVSGIGSALLDITFEVDEKILSELSLKKGEMYLIDKEKSALILNKLKDLKSVASPGGSVANTIHGATLLGGKGVLFGKLGKDSNGDVYEKNTKSTGVLGKFSKDLTEMTGHAITFITPDGERTFATHLGAALSIKKNDIDQEIIKDSKILHVEGYLFDIPDMKKSLFEIAKIAKENNVLISIDLSDAGCVKRNHDLFLDFVKNYSDIVFANETEAMAFTSKDDPKEALTELAKLTKIAIVKIGENGSMIRSSDTLIIIPVYKNGYVNTNGAGDNYAGAFLYALANDYTLEESGHLASFVSSLVVSNSTARLNREYLDKIKKFHFYKIL